MGKGEGGKEGGGEERRGNVSCSTASRIDRVRLRQKRPLPRGGGGIRTLSDIMIPEFIFQVNETDRQAHTHTHIHTYIHIYIQI